MKRVEHIFKTDSSESEKSFFNIESEKFFVSFHRRNVPSIIYNLHFAGIEEQADIDHAVSNFTDAGKEHVANS